MLDELNPLQKEAVMHINGPLIINAGPGTGKTKTLVSKIYFLIKQVGTNPKDIVAITFTVKAAKELQNRLEKLLSNQESSPDINTFHAHAYSLIQKKVKEKNIISDIERFRIINDTKNNFSELKGLPTKEIAQKISLQKSGDSNTNLPEELLNTYEKVLAENDFIDYDDLILKANKLIANKLAFIPKFILVDEFQDTNKAQYEFLKNLIGYGQNITVIGDPLQSIYSFRGATPKAFSNFKKDFREYREIILKENYRSTQKILDASYSLFPESKPIESKVNFAKIKKPKLVITQNEFTEADWILKEISQSIGGIDLNQASDVNGKTTEENKTMFSDFAVLYRTHGLNRILEQKFIDSGIPYQLVGGESLYEKKCIRFLTNLIKLTQDFDNITFAQVAKSSVVKLSKATVEKIQTLNSEHLGTLKFLEILVKNKQFSKGETNKLTNLITLINTIQNPHKKLDTKIQEVVETAKLEELYPKQIRYLNEFLSTIAKYNKLKSEKQIPVFLADIEKLEETDFYDSSADKVTLLTIHSSKGLEFQKVFIIGLEDGLIPHIKNKTNFEEEKRLLFVAMTRAKENLTLVRTLNRNREKTTESEFEKYLTEKSLEKIKDPQIKKIQKRKEIQKQKKSQMELF